MIKVTTVNISDFVGMEVPQIQVQLRLVCQDERIEFDELFSSQSNMLPFVDGFDRSTPRYIDSSYEDGRSYVLMRNISFSPTLTLLTVIIKDINNNFPIVTNPPYNPYTVGYPEFTVVSKLLPPYLLKLKAYDNDFGLNAAIQYVIDENDHFSVDPVSGEIVPKPLAMMDTDEVNLFYNAIDQNGTGNSYRATMTVVKLKTSNLVYVSLKETTQDIDSIITMLTEKTSSDIRVLNSAVVPRGEITGGEEDNELLRQSASGIDVILVIYALENNKPITADDLIS